MSTREAFNRTHDTSGNSVFLRTLTIFSAVRGRLGLVLVSCGGSAVDRVAGEVACLCLPPAFAGLASRSAKP